MRSKISALRSARHRNRTRNRQSPLPTQAAGLADLSSSVIAIVGSPHAKPASILTPARIFKRSREPQTQPCACGQPVVVCILEGYAAGRPVYRHLCAGCDRKWTVEARNATQSPRGVWRRSFGTLGIALGTLLSLAAIGADQLVVQSHAGFGMWQQLGVLVGLSGVLLGITLRLDFVSVAGVLTLGLAGAADHLGPFGTAAGAGARQSTAMAGAVVLLIIGLLLYRGAAKRSPSAPTSAPLA